MAINIVIPKARSAPTIPAEIAPDYSLIQEKFPKIGEKIAVLWGSEGLQEYLNKTIFDERGGRQGLPLPIVSALMRIYEHHGTLILGAKAGHVSDHIE
jgi:hypothetical protein